MNDYSDIVIPLTLFIGGTIIAVVAMLLRAKRSQNEHKERLLALEKGLPVPPPAFPPIRKRNPYLWGFVLMAFGLAISIGMLNEGDPDWVYGGVFFFPGAAILIANLLHQRDLKREEKPEESSSGEGGGSAEPPPP